MKRKRSNNELIASVFFKYKRTEYATALVIPVKNISAADVRDQGYQLVDAVIRTLQKNHGII